MGGYSLPPEVIVRLIMRVRILGGDLHSDRTKLDVIEWEMYACSLGWLG